MQIACANSGRLRAGAANSFGVTVVLSIAFLLFLKPNVTHTLEFLGLPAPFSPEVYSALLVGVSFACVGLRLWWKRIDIFVGLMLAVVAWVGIVTVKNGGDTGVVFTDWLPLLAIVCLVSALGQSYRRSLLNAMFFACVFYLILNLVGILREGDIGIGSQTHLFYAIKTATFRIAIPALVCSLLLDNLDGRRVSLPTISVYLLCLFEVIVGYAATSLVTLLLLGLLVMLGFSTKIRKCLNAFTFVLADLGVFLGIVVLRFQNALGWLIQDVLGKSLTLSGRVYVWDEVFRLLSNSHLLWGYGGSYLWDTIYTNGIWYKHAHNDILNILMVGGLVLAVLAVALLALAAFRLFLSRSQFPSFVLSCGLGCFLLEGLFEITPYPGFFFVLALGYYYQGVVSGHSEHEA